MEDAAESKKDSGSAAATSNSVYIMDKNFAWIPARLVDVSGDTAKVSIPQYADESLILSDGGKGATGWKDDVVKLKFYPGKTLPLQNCDKAGNLVEKEDMVDLPFLHEVRAKLEKDTSTWFIRPMTLGHFSLSFRTQCL